MELAIMYLLSSCSNIYSSWSIHRFFPHIHIMFAGLGFKTSGFITFKKVKTGVSSSPYFIILQRWLTDSHGWPCQMQSFRTLTRSISSSFFFPFKTMEAKPKWDNAHTPDKCNCPVLLGSSHSTQNHWLRFHCRMWKKGRQLECVRKTQRRRTWKNPKWRKLVGKKLDEDENMYEKTHTIHI